MASVEIIPRVCVDDEWHRWVAEKLLLGRDPQGVYARMLEAGVAVTDAVRELQQAQRSPYIAGAQRLKNRLAKHDWVLDNQRRLNRLLPPEIPRRLRPSRQDFLRDHYSAGRPVLITGLMDGWPALSKWSFEYFASHFAERIVQVQFNRRRHDRYEANQATPRKTMQFGDFLQRLRAAGRERDFYLAACSEGPNRRALGELWNDIAPLPDYLTAQSQVHGCLWFGAQGTRIPLHHDLANQLMAQVVGRRRVRVIPACEIAHVYNTLQCFSAIDGRHIDVEHYPLMRDVRVLDCTLNPGEILFLPVGCWYFVEALDASVTVSFTNFIWDNDFTAAYPECDTF